MKPQNQEPNNFSRNPLEPGRRDEGSQTPAGGSFETASGDGARKKRNNPRFQSVSEMSIRKLKRIHGACKGGNPVVADELRCRGFNAKMLEELVWEWGQRQWEKAAKRASKIATTRNVEARRQKKRAKEERRRERSRERQRQEQQARLDRLKEGVVIVGKNYDPSNADGSCPF